MKFDLARMAKAQGVRKPKTLRPSALPKNLANELATIMAQVPAAWASNAPAIIREYETTLSTLTTDSPASVSDEIDAMQAEIDRLILRLQPSLRSWAVRVEKWQRGKWVAAALTAARVDLSTMLTVGDVAETLETSLARTVSLIKDISGQARQRISEAVFTGFQKRATTRETAKVIREAVAMSRARSIRVAAHQTQVLAATLNRERQIQAGMDKYEWVHSGKQNGREDHIERDGNVYAWGELTEQPGDAINCGCQSGPILSLDD